MPAPYADQRKIAQRILSELMTHKATARIIHYASESFVGRENGRSARVTAIAIKNIDNGSVTAFSIKAKSEALSLAPEGDTNLDEIESAMLGDFFEYLRSSGEVINYVHWNMRDANYGFPAIEHRYSILKGQPYVVPERRRFDLSRLLLDVYGTEYIEHPRLQRLAEKNDITTLGFLTGKQEAESFERAEYQELQQSTLRKVDVLSDIAERAHRRTLRTNSNWWVQHGGNFRGAWDGIVENKSIAFIFTLTGIVFGILGTTLALKH